MADAAEILSKAFMQIARKFRDRPATRSTKPLSSLYTNRRAPTPEEPEVETSTALVPVYTVSEAEQAAAEARRQEEYLQMRAKHPVYVHKPPAEYPVTPAEREYLQKLLNRPIS